MICDPETGEVIPVFLRTPFNYDMDSASLASGLYCSDPTRTQQQFEPECNINNIVERFGLTGELPQGASIPFNADFEDNLTYQEALNLLVAADAAFMQYPAEIRAQFQNDPGKFVDFVSDPANLDQVKKWGLTRAETVPPAPITVRVIPEATPTNPTAPEAVKAT